jgi:hypothetical protein
MDFDVSALQRLVKDPRHDDCQIAIKALSLKIRGDGGLLVAFEVERFLVGYAALEVDVDLTRG